MPPKKAPSPYKKVLQRNNNYCGFVRMNNLTPNRAYKIYQLKHTTHEKYGEGELAFVETNTGLKQRVQLPTKYLRDLTDEEIQCWYSDILNNLCPYLVFRQQLIDTSFEIDIFQRTDELDDFHRTWAEVPPRADIVAMFDSSIEENDDTNTDKGNHKDTDPETSENGKRKGSPTPTQNDPKKSKE